MRAVRPIGAVVCVAVSLAGGYGFLTAGSASGKIVYGGLGLLFGLVAFWNLDFF